ncbi:MAG: hypothetical protein F7C35_08820 [Desulfurococcales archaeon]|nr:hypothetical protein [Desulfurococcales archaeon]
MSEVVLPRTLLAVAVILIAASALGALYYYYHSQVIKTSVRQVVDAVGGSMGEAAGGGSSQSQPISLSGGSVSVVYEDHPLDIYYNVSETLPPIGGINVSPSIYEADVSYPILKIVPGTQVEPINTTGLILAVAPVEEGLSSVTPLVYGYSDGTNIYIIPRILILYSDNPDVKALNITIVVPKINLSCSTGSCTDLKGKYVVRVDAKIVDILPIPYVSYNPFAEGRQVEASLDYGQGSLIPHYFYGKTPVAEVGLDYKVYIDIQYLYYDIYFERVG